MNNKLDEFKRGWLQLFACAIGLGIGVIGLASYNLGLFAGELHKAIGLTKTQYGAGYLAFTLGLALGLQFWGRVLSRFGAACTAAVSALALALCFVMLGTWVGSPTSYVILVGLLGFFGGGTSGLTFTRVVSGWFDAGRGFALGLTQVGLGLAGALLPPVIAATLDSHGWKTGYFALAVIAACGAPIAMIILREDRVTDTQPRVKLPPSELAALSAEFAEVRRSRTFWLMLIAFTLSTLFVAGAAQHMAPMLRELGATPAATAGILSLIGVGTICVRLIVGWLCDYVHAPWLMAFSCLVGMGGVLAIYFGGLGYAPIYAFAIGWAFGGEIDVVAYLCTRYFSLRTFPRAYAWQYGALCLSAGVGPFGVGWLADHWGSYQPSLLVSAALAASASAIFLVLPSYKNQHDHRHVENIDASPPLAENK